MSVPFPKEVNRIKDVVLQRIFIGSEMTIDRRLLQRGEIRIVDAAEDLARDLLLRCETFLYADAPTVVRVEYPANWWEHFKQRWFPKWAQKRWPVLTEVRELVAQHIYPQLDPQLGDRYASTLRMKVIDPRK